jgi:hypothetical protein
MYMFDNPVDILSFTFLAIFFNHAGGQCPEPASAIVEECRQVV